MLWSSAEKKFAGAVPFMESHRILGMSDLYDNEEKTLNNSSEHQKRIMDLDIQKCMVMSE